MKDFNEINFRFDNFEIESFLSENDFIDDTHEISSTIVSSSEDLSKIKINKYQGLDNFFKKMMDEEKKKNEIAKIEKKSPPPNWKQKLFPDAFPNFLNIFRENPKNIIENKSPNENKDLNNHNNTNSSSENIISGMNMNESKTQTQKAEQVKNRRQFNKLFPLRKIKRSESLKNMKTFIHEENFETPRNIFRSRLTMFKPPVVNRFSNICDNSFENEKPKKLQRKLSFKNLDQKETISFLENLKTNIESPNKQILENIKKKLEMELKENDDKKSEIESGKVDAVWGVCWEQKVLEFREKSDFGHFPSYQIKNIIIKGGDDLRQELIAMQMIIKFKQIFDDAELKLFLRPYDIMVTSPNSGILGEIFPYEEIL